jgi:hypothetical protein
MSLEWKTGFEIELVMPKGKSRLDLARRVAARTGGTIHRIFHAQAELSSIEGKPTFQNLTPGFEVVGSDGQMIARFVDDLTLLDGFDLNAPPLPGWYRIVTDDSRLVSLIEAGCDPDAGMETVLEPLAAMFGTALEHHSSGMAKVSDRKGSSVAIVAELSGERERGCEIVTAPIASNHAQALAALIDDAMAEGLTVPLEAALHIHYDAAPLLSARTISRLVTVLDRHGEALKDRVGTNPNCRRLGLWPDDLIDLVADEEFLAMDWPEARRALQDLALTKFCDFNLLNIAQAAKGKHTFEVRILPVSLDAGEIVAQAELFAAILDWAIAPDDRDLAEDFETFIGNLPLPPDAIARWGGTIDSGGGGQAAREIYKIRGVGK